LPSHWNELHVAWQHVSASHEAAFPEHFTLLPKFSGLSIPHLNELQLAWQHVSGLHMYPEHLTWLPLFTGVSPPHLTELHVVPSQQSLALHGGEHLTSPLFTGSWPPQWNALHVSA
jgi:hypothetical protein